MEQKEILKTPCVEDIVDVLLKEGLEEEYEVTAILSSPSIRVSYSEGKVVGLESYPSHSLLSSLLEDIGIDMTLFLFVVQDEFFVQDVWLHQEHRMMTPFQRGNFIEFFNANRAGYRLKHVPVIPTVLRLLGAKAALLSGVQYETVRQDVLLDIKLLANSSVLSHPAYKGMLFRSLTSDKRFYCLCNELSSETDS